MYVNRIFSARNEAFHFIIYEKFAALMAIICYKGKLEDGNEPEQLRLPFLCETRFSNRYTYLCSIKSSNSLPYRTLLTVNKYFMLDFSVSYRVDVGAFYHIDSVIPFKAFEIFNDCKLKMRGLKSFLKSSFVRVVLKMMWIHLFYRC